MKEFKRIQMFSKVAAVAAVRDGLRPACVRWRLVSPYRGRILGAFQLVNCEETMARMRYGSGKVFVIRHQDFILASIKEGKTLAMIHEEIVAATKESISHHALVYHINQMLLGKSRFNSNGKNGALLHNKIATIEKSTILVSKEEKSAFELSINANKDKSI